MVTLLFQAIREDNVELVQHEFSRLNARTAFAALHTCVSKRMLELVLKLGGDARQVNEAGYTPLHFTDNLDACMSLLEHGADPTACENRTRQTPLHTLAGFLRDTRVIPTLLAAGACVNTRDAQGRLPLFFAGSEAVQLALIEHGSDIDFVDTYMEARGVCAHVMMVALAHT